MRKRKTMIILSGNLEEKDHEIQILKEQMSRVQLLVDRDGKGKYRAAEFVWFQAVAPTALKFLNSAKLGKQYQNDMFVGDYKNGNLYHFELNQNRTGLVLSSSLADKIAYTPEDAKPVIFGTFDGGITDLQVGPDVKESRQNNTNSNCLLRSKFYNIPYIRNFHYDENGRVLHMQ